MSFVRFDFGLGAAASWLMLLMALLLCLFYCELCGRSSEAEPGRG